jgi:aspartate aminotransferase-like enzyme
MQISEQRNQLALKEIEAEEVKIEKKPPVDMDDEDWDQVGDSRKPSVTATHTNDSEDSADSYDSNGEQDSFQRAQSKTRKAVKALGLKIFANQSKNPELTKKWVETYIPLLKQ